MSLAVVGVCLPQPLLAAGAETHPKPIVQDVVLQDGGVLLGKVVSPQGIALSKVPVSLQDQRREVARGVTDQNGCFAVRGLRTGVYQLVGAGSHGTCRMWTRDSAPPTSQPGVLLVAGDTIRGQCSDGCDSGCGNCKGSLAFWLANPWVVAGVLATAVAVPVAVHNSERPSSP
ncbi:MAG: carboxypeptidase regulatory-like domain-containing protein [Pirellulales bacterium]|nr:carboxypeptidase regulatory-like domain-containing protein [Pirellulales bacterium]